MITSETFVQKPNNLIFNNPSFKHHEQILFCQDEETGLKAIIGIHSTALGPALGGTRMWNYKNEYDALVDVLRLSRGMTYKAAISDLALGGGKAVIIGDARKHKTDELMLKFGEFVNSLSGRYITAEDVGMTTRDMELVKQKTNFVTGIPESMGGAGDPSPVTAYGVFMGMKAAAKFAYGSDDLAGKRVLVQGVGHVGETVVKHLAESGADILINDIYEDSLEKVAKKYGAEIVRDNIYRQDVDIYSPCALGATVNDATIEQLKCKVIAGAANNQLADERIHGLRLRERGIVYAPDFLINAGGLINVNSEIAGYSRDEVFKRTENIYNTTLNILGKAEEKEITTHQAALTVAKERVEQARKNQ